MQTVDFNGAVFTPVLFCKIWDEAMKLSRPRFLTLRASPLFIKEIEVFAAPPKSIQIGDTLGPIVSSRPKVIRRVNCITPPKGVADGIEMKADEKMPPNTIVFEIHGIPELVCKNVRLFDEVFTTANSPEHVETSKGPADEPPQAGDGSDRPN